MNCSPIHQGVRGFSQERFSHSRLVVNGSFPHVSGHLSWESSKFNCPLWNLGLRPSLQLLLIYMQKSTVWWNLGTGGLNKCGGVEGWWWVKLFSSCTSSEVQSQITESTCCAGFKYSCTSPVIGWCSHWLTQKSLLFHSPPHPRKPCACANELLPNSSRCAQLFSGEVLSFQVGGEWLIPSRQRSPLLRKFKVQLSSVEPWLAAISTTTSNLHAKVNCVVKSGNLWS